MYSLLEAATNIITEGKCFCLVTIIETRGSTPRDVGARMMVTEHHNFYSIGGGNLELQAILAARKILKTKRPLTQDIDYILGPDTEQCCGGKVKLRLEIIQHMDGITDLRKREIAQQKTQLYLFGAGHVGTALMRALAPLPFSVSCFDNREEKCTQPCHPGLDPGPRRLPQSRGPGAEAGLTVKVAVVQHFINPKQTILTAPKNTLFLIMTHDHNLDYELVSAVLTRDDFAFLGLIGSNTKCARFISRLKKDGFTDAQLSRLTCPVGIEGIQGKEPEIIAASVAAQLLRIRTQNGD